MQGLDQWIMNVPEHTTSCEDAEYYYCKDCKELVPQSKKNLCPSCGLFIPISTECICN